MPRWNTKRGEGFGINWLRSHIAYDGADCLIWPLFRMPNGRGVVGFEGKVHQAHRVMCELVNGPCPPGHEAAHNCGNGHGGCVHPKHVIWKTHVDNMADRAEHGTDGWTAKRGGKRYKLTMEKATEIRALQGQLSATMVGELYGVTEPTIRKIWHNEIWMVDRDQHYPRRRTVNTFVS